MQISERIYQISGGMYQNIANVYAIRTDEGLILIDCGETEEDLALMQEIMKRWDLDHLKVTHVLLTHKHFGHIGNAAWFREHSALIAAGERDADDIEQGKWSSILDFSPFPEHGPYIPVHVDLRLHDGEMIESGGVRIEVLETPGHTEGSVMFRMEEEGRQVLFAGDVIGIASEGRGVTLGWEGGEDFDMQAYFKSLLRLSEEPCEVILPGHMQPVMQNGHILLKKAVGIALTKWRRLGVDTE